MQPNEEPDPSALPPELRELREKLLESRKNEASAGQAAEKVPLLPDLLMGLAAIALFAYLFEFLGLFNELPKVAGYGLSGGSFGAIGGGLAAWFVGLFLLRAHRRLVSRLKRRDAQATALIVAADLARSPSRSGGWVYAVLVGFQFQANGRMYTGNFRVPENASHNMMSRHERVMKQNHPGKTVSIAYESVNPENCGLVRRPPIPWLPLALFLVVGGALTGFGVYMLRVGLSLLTA